MSGRSGGFSLVELLIAMAMMVTFSSAVMALILAGQSMARMQPEAADVQQRGRIALQTLGAELAVAGAGLDRGPLGGPLAQYFSPVLPSADGGITVWYVSGRAADNPCRAVRAGGRRRVYRERRRFQPGEDLCEQLLQPFVGDGRGRDLRVADDSTDAHRRLHDRA